MRLSPEAQPTGPAPRNALLEPVPGDVIAFLHAHPDDESIFTGGTLARLAAAGATTVLVTATLGELGRPSGPRTPAGPRDEAALAAVRKRELRRACAVLGVTRHLFLGGEGRFADSGHPPVADRQNSLAANAEAATADLLRLLCGVRPRVLVTYDEHGSTGHPDHRACHRIALRAGRALARLDAGLQGVALIADSLPSVERAARRLPGDALAIDVSAFRERRESAIGCHVSQGGDAVRDARRLAALDPASAMTRCLPRVLSAHPEARHERYAWVPSRALAA